MRIMWNTVTTKAKPFSSGVASYDETGDGECLIIEASLKF